SHEIDNYSLIPSYSTLGNTWDNIYIYGIKNADALIDRANEASLSYYAGIGRVLRAYAYLNLTDLFGDIPYSEANVPGIEFPKADKSADIYNALLVELNQALKDFAATEGNSSTPGTNDLFYNGNITKWIKATNTLKLKLLTQSRLAKDEINNWKAELDSLIAEDNFIGNGEDLQFPHTGTLSPADERKSGYTDEYEASQKGVWVSPWLYEIMNGKTYNAKNNPFAGIVDPRVPYYYFNQLTADADAVSPTDYRDGAFVSILMGSNSTYSSMTQDAAMTVIGIYPVGGKYDDGNGGAIGAKSGSGIAPDKMLQAYSVPFMKAELALAGEITANAKELLEDAIDASIAHVNAVVAKADANAPLIEDYTLFKTNVLSQFDKATDAKKMEIVMTQKWIANFYHPIEAYNDIRRTGYPVLFTGNDERKAVSPFDHTVAATDMTAEGGVELPIIKISDYPRILWYPQGECDVNPNISNKDRNVTVSNVFWDVQ
ncbi:MAG: SusD/RagB family nutrient-binding outer membrane lipoprotein, partial [Bacteroidaceae bacterium]|nr:SusD/RagB family nutrient-binding outer membrane lipoprotein [Bacteroidaceae bacterium]